MTWEGCVHPILKTQPDLEHYAVLWHMDWQAILDAMRLNGHDAHMYGYLTDDTLDYELSTKVYRHHAKRKYYRTRNLSC